jgi:ABC-2 type transport system ATP-binding protein
MISVEGLAKRYGDVTAVDGVSFEVGSGEVFGLVGPNGAGKTSTLKMLCGLVEPSDGDVTVNGYDAGETEMRRSLGFLPEESPLYEEMTPRGYLRFFADLYGVDRGTANERIEAALDRLDLDARDRPVGDFSKGMKRKVAIARSLVNDPDVLVYDEPASGLDPLTTNTVIEFTQELADDGKTIVFSAHDLHHVESVCDRVAIMRDGSLAATGTLAEIRERYGEVSYRVFTDIALPETEPSGDGRHVAAVDSMGEVDALRDAASDAGGAVVDIRTDESTLEDVFLDVTGA